MDKVTLVERELQRQAAAVTAIRGGGRERAIAQALQDAYARGAEDVRASLRALLDVPSTSQCGTTAERAAGEVAKSAGGSY